MTSTESNPAPLAALVLRHPLAGGWALYFAFGVAAAVTVQFVVLPLLPQLHAGHGLLAGTDAVAYHAIATELAAEIGRHGWSAWTLAPAGQPAAGLAAAFYAVLAPEPWTLIAVNAGLHATAGILLVALLRGLEVEATIALAGGALFVCFPSSLQWVAQIQKNGYFIAGMLGALLGCVWLLQGAWWRGAALLGAGTLAAGLMRPYSFQLLQVFALGVAAWAALGSLAGAMRRQPAARRAACVCGLALAVAVLLNYAPRDLRIEPAERNGAANAAGQPAAAIIDGRPWQANSWLPSAIDDNFLRLALARRGYLGSAYRTAGSMIDLERQFHSAADVLAYLPRAAQIGFAAPFPALWLSHGSSPGGTWMRAIAGLEMLIVYPLLFVGLPLAVRRWHARPAFWLIAAFCGLMVVSLALVTPNLGTLHRLRYGFLMTLAALGLAAILQTLRERAARRRTA